MIKEKLAKFLQKAKKRTFASRISISKRTKDGGKEYSYSEGEFVYKDKYFGSVVDTGQELVWHKNRLIWSMSYRGGMINNKELTNKCFSFLKKCLRKVPLEFPVRGPKDYKEGELRYENNWKGNLENFVGEEKIFCKEEQIYFRNYLGGMGKLLSLS
jgi:hypothetical protein|tara:strand:+ start:2328 stop:2798 length:471 start_codon:yes stop_codon:yes gene_type:complete